MARKKETKQKYIKGKQGGWDGKHWRRPDGRFSTEAMSLSREPTLEYGALIQVKDDERYAVIRAARAIEYTVTGQDPEKLRTAILHADTTAADPMPSDIRAMMDLADYYTKTEGDVYQTIEAPLQIGLRELTVSSKDKGVETEFKELYDELDMFDVMQGMWLCNGIYGQSFPFEIYEEEDPTGVYLLNPKHMQVGKTVTFGWYSLDWQVGEGWIEQVKQSVDPKLVFRSLASDANETYQQGYVGIPRESCRPVTHLKMPFQRYAIPPLARAYRAISTRQVLEELIRATIEGYRNQLWVFRLGDENTKVSSQKMQHFVSMISESTGDRTGYLVWTHDLQVDVFAPRPLDQMLGDQRWHALTAHIFRQLGISTRIISGEAPMGASRTGEELDVKILLARLEWMRQNLIRWLRDWNRRYAQRKKNVSARKKMLDNLPRVQFGEDFLEKETLMRGFMQPLMQGGKVSNQTLLEQLGFSYDLELQRKIDEEELSYLFAAQAIYAQPVPTKLENIQYTPEGRPPEGQPPKKPIKVEAARQDFPPEVQTFEDKIVQAYDDILTADDREQAIMTFKDIMVALNIQYVHDAYVEGYRIAQGAEEISQERINEAVKWNNDYLDNFISDLEANIEDDAQLETWRNRAKLYAQAGHKRGYMMGIFQAMIERGARGWRRVLHPELSESGPCDVCIADSRLIHPITEEFTDHVWGVCSSQSVYFYREYGYVEVPMGFPFTEFPVPYDTRIVRRVR